MTTANILFFIALGFMIAVVASFFGGMISMTRGGEEDNKTSNKMMRLRVTFQGLALIFLLLSFLARGN